MQAKQAEVESDRRAVQYELQANDILRRTNQANAAVVARGFAGGTQGLSGLTTNSKGKTIVFGLKMNWSICSRLTSILLNVVFFDFLLLLLVIKANIGR